MINTMILADGLLARFSCGSVFKPSAHKTYPPVWCLTTLCGISCASRSSTSHSLLKGPQHPESYVDTDMIRRPSVRLLEPIEGETTAT